MIALLVKLGDPWDSMLWDVPPVPVHVQVTIVPVKTVSTAGSQLPFRALRKKRFPTVTWPAAPPPPFVHPPEGD